MNGWQFWEDGILGIVFILGGTLVFYGAFRDIPDIQTRKGLDAKKIKRNCRTLKILGVVIIVWGILKLTAYPYI